jgi:hypothetical protein
MNKEPLLIACDPELFVMKDGKISSIAGILGYGKLNKLDTGKGVRLQEDNVLLEFDIDPCKTLAAFDGLVSDALLICKDVAKTHGFELAMGVSSHNYSPEEIALFPSSAKEFGCSSDLNVLTTRMNPVPMPRKGLRTAGGHVHIGFVDHMGLETEYAKSEKRQEVGIMCDFMLGLPSLFEDKNDLRRTLYGQAGAIRNKEYGIEYRTLSNYWLENHRKDVYNRVTKIVELVKNDHAKEIFNMISPFGVQDAINKGDRNMAESYLKILETV